MLLRCHIDLRGHRSCHFCPPTLLNHMSSCPVRHLQQPSNNHHKAIIFKRSPILQSPRRCCIILMSDRFDLSSLRSASRVYAGGDNGGATTFPYCGCITAWNSQCLQSTPPTVTTIPVSAVPHRASANNTEFACWLHSNSCFSECFR